MPTMGWLSAMSPVEPKKRGVAEGEDAAVGGDEPVAVHVETPRAHPRSPAPPTPTNAMASAIANVAARRTPRAVEEHHEVVADGRPRFALMPAFVRT